MLKRAEIRKAIIDQLKNKTLAGERVYAGLPFATAEEDCPCVLVYTTQENCTTRAKHVPLYETSLTIIVEARVTGDYASAEEVLDVLCEQIEARVLGEQKLRGMVEAITSVSTQKAWEDGGEYPLFVAMMSIVVEYKREFIADIQDEYLTASVKMDTIDPADPNLAAPGPDGRIEATVEVIVNQ